MFNNKNSLITYVKKEKKSNKKIISILNQKFEPLWIPSIRSFLIIASFIGFFGILSNLEYINSFIIWFIHLFNNICDNSFLYITELKTNYIFSQINQFFDLGEANFDNHFLSLISIHSGIGAVLIGMAFFVAQNLVDKNDPDKGRVLLYKSYFFPLLTAEILAFFLFLLGKVNFFTIFIVILLGLSTIFFLGSTINILIKDHEMEKAKKEMFFEILRRNFIKILDYEITKRIGSNTLYKKADIIEKETNGLIKISPFGIFSNRIKYFSVNSSHKGIVVDINFDNLNKFIDFIKSIAKENKKTKLNFNTSNRIQQDLGVERQEPYIYILPSFLEHIPEEIIQIREDFFNEGYNERENDLKKISKLANDIFEVNDRQEIEKEARLEVSKVKDRCIKAIKNEETGELKKILDFYLDITNEFFDYIKLYGGGFSQEQAEKERTSFLERLKPIEWLSRDIREIVEKGMKSEEINVVREIMYLPIRLANEAIKNKDHLVFQEFIYFPRLLYSYAYERKETNKKISNFMFDRTWRHLKELSDYHLESKLKKGKYEEEDFIGFSMHLLKVFQSLVKASFDNRDIENFSIFLSKTNTLFKHLRRNNFYEDKKEGLFDKVNKKRQEMFFGIASWVLFEFEGNKNDIMLKKLFEKVCEYLPKDIETLTKVFLRVHTYDTEHFWGWNNWELEKKDEDSDYIHGIYILEKLETLYVVQSLKILQLVPSSNIVNIKIPHNRDIVSLAEGNRDLLKILESINDNPNEWDFVLTNGAVSKIDIFKNLLNKAKKRQEEEDLKRKRDTNISSQKVKLFKENVVKNFHESAGIRNIFKYYNLFEDKSKKLYTGKIKKLGINTMFNKEPFFDDSVKWHVHFMGFDNGFDFGTTLIDGENREIIQKIKVKLPLVKRKDFLKQLINNNDLGNIFIISLNGSSHRFFEKEKGLKQYIPKRQLEIKNNYPQEISGILKLENEEIPVYEIYDRSGEFGILVLNKNNIGKIIQYNPLDINEDRSLLQDIFHMDVGAFDENSKILLEFLRKPPKWLKEVGDKTKQEKHLKERVVIKIFERFEFITNKEIKGFFVKIRR